MCLLESCLHSVVVVLFSVCLFNQKRFQIMKPLPLSSIYGQNQIAVELNMKISIDHGSFSVFKVRIIVYCRSI